MTDSVYNNYLNYVLTNSYGYNAQPKLIASAAAIQKMGEAASKAQKKWMAMNMIVHDEPEEEKLSLWDQI